MYAEFQLVVGEWRGSGTAVAATMRFSFCSKSAEAIPTPRSAREASRCRCNGCER